jgi:YggT family protein
MLGAIVDVLLLILRLYTYVVIAAVIVSWLINFGVINTYNNFVRSIVSALYALTEPVFRQIRRVLPAMGGLDLSPLIVLIIIYFLEQVLVREFYF